MKLLKFQILSATLFLLSTGIVKAQTVASGTEFSSHSEYRAKIELYTGTMDIQFEPGPVSEEDEDNHWERTRNLRGYYAGIDWIRPGKRVETRSIIGISFRYLAGSYKVVQVRNGFRDIVTQNSDFVMPSALAYAEQDFSWLAAGISARVAYDTDRKRYYAMPGFHVRLGHRGLHYLLGLNDRSHPGTEYFNAHLGVGFDVADWFKIEFGICAAGFSSHEDNRGIGGYLVGGLTLKTRYTLQAEYVRYMSNGNSINLTLRMRVP